MAFLTATSRILGGHLVHVVVLVGWVVSVVVVVAWPSGRTHGSGAAVPAGASPTGDVPYRSRAYLQAAALATFASALCHVAVMPDHFRESWLYGTFFVVAASLQVGLGALLLSRPSRRLLGMALAGSMAIVGLWAYTRLVSVPLGPGAGTREQIGVLDVLSSACEVATACCALLVLRGRVLRPSWRWSAWSGPMRSALFGTAAVMAVVVAAVPKG